MACRLTGSVAVRADYPVVSLKRLPVSEIRSGYGFGVLMPTGETRDFFG
jgi:hypothetical protein